MIGQSNLKALLGSKSKAAALCVYGYGPSKSPFLKQARTLNAHAQGCSLILGAPVRCGEKLLLMHGRAQNPVVAKITTVRNLTTRILEVEVAFDAPRPDFWQTEKP